MLCVSLAKVINELVYLKYDTSAQVKTGYNLVLLGLKLTKTIQNLKGNDTRWSSILKNMNQ